MAMKDIAATAAVIRQPLEYQTRSVHEMRVGATLTASMRERSSRDGFGQGAARRASLTSRRFME
jgi:hypothetical protein